jgi:hypothetical protein
MFIPNRFLQDRRELGEIKSRQKLGQFLTNAEVNSTHSDVTLELPLHITPSHLSQGSLEFFQLDGRFDHLFIKDFRAAAAEGGGGTHNLSNRLYYQLLDTLSLKRILFFFSK